MATEPDVVATVTSADLTYPPDPFHHGPCRVDACTYGHDGGPAPAVFEGGLCAKHTQEIGRLSVAAGLQERAKQQQEPKPMTRKVWDHLKSRRKSAAKSRSRNRR